MVTTTRLPTVTSTKTGVTAVLDRWFEAKNRPMSERAQPVVGPSPTITLRPGRPSEPRSVVAAEEAA